MDGVQGFDAFTPDNEPYGEQDFGALNVSGVSKVFLENQSLRP